MTTLSSSADSTFPTDVLQSPLPVLVDFWGEWCGPCKAMLPTLEQLAAYYAGRAKIVKVEMDKKISRPRWRGACARRRRCCCSRAARCTHATHVGMASKAQLAKLIDAAL